AETALPPPLADQPAIEAAQSPAPAPPLPPPFEPADQPGPEASPEPSALPPPFAAPVQAGWEQRLGARAFVWIGAVTLALAAVFLVRYSIEEGYLSPEIRV